jgi:orotate phosphoribosyltransferase
MRITEDTRRNLAEKLVGALTCSHHTLTAGASRNYFINLDALLTQPDTARVVVAALVDEIRGVQEQSGPIHRLCIVEVAEQGPVGLVNCSSALSIQTGIAGVLIRPNKRLYESQLVGMVAAGDRVLFVGDVLTTGEKFASAVAILGRKQAHIVHAIYVYDGMCGGRENTAPFGLVPESLVDIRHLREAAGLTAEQRNALTPNPNPDRRDLMAVVAAYQ